MEGSDRRWRGALVSGGERSQVERSDLMWAGALACGDKWWRGALAGGGV